jgi:hypothetical protein
MAKNSNRLKNKHVEKIRYLFPIVVGAILLSASFINFNRGSVVAQEVPEPQNSQILSAQGASFKQGWNYFKLGFSDCTVTGVLNELQADGGSALKAESLYIKEILDWKSYSYLNENSKKRKVNSNELIAFNSNQNFYFDTSKQVCLSKDSARQEQIDIVRQGISEKSSLVEKVRDLPNDLWARLVEVLNSDTPSPTSSIGEKILEDLTFGGKTVVKDLGVTGKISSGLLLIEGLSDNEVATVNTLGGDLYIQNEGIGGVNFVSGKVVIDKNGNLKASKLNFDTSNSSTSSIGSATISAGSTSIDIQTSAVTGASKIFVTATSETGGQSLIVKSKTPGRGFRVIVEKTYSANITFDWFVVN